MRKFQDSKDRFWEVEIHVGTLRLLKKLLGVDLALITSLAGLAKIVEDPIALVDVLYVVCKSQADAAGVTDEQFGQGFSGDSLLEGADAFIQSWIDFQADPGGREVLRETVKQARLAQAACFDRAHVSLKKLDIPQIANEIFAKQLSAS